MPGCLTFLLRGVSEHLYFSYYVGMITEWLQNINLQQNRKTLEFGTEKLIVLWVSEIIPKSKFSIMIKELFCVECRKFQNV